MKKVFLKDPQTRNIGYLTLLVFVLSLQVLIVLVFVYQFIPLKMDPITEGVPPALLQFFKPNRNHLFYHAFVAAALIGQVMVLYMYRKRLAVADLAGEIREFLIGETFWVSWQLFAVFKILQYDNPSWARILLYAGFTAALLAKVFWPELKRGLKLFQVWLGKDMPAKWRIFADGGIIFILLLSIAIPDTEKALLRLSLADNNNHFDQWLMAPLWAYHKGLIPAFQAANPLNWGVPVLIHALVGFIGGVTYGHVIAVLCFLAIVYYSAFYYFLRFWLGILPAVFGVLLAVKLQMFHIGVFPLIWAFPGQSILRHLFDVAVFFCLWCYARGQGEVFLWLAGALIGISLGFVFDTGVYMLGALYAYVAVLMSFKDTRCLFCPTPKQWRKVFGLVLLPWFIMFMALAFCFGPVVLHGEFWTYPFEGSRNRGYWLEGLDAVSIYSCLKDRNFFAYFASFFPPLIYTVGSAAVISMVYFRRWSSEKLFLIPLSVYGLGVYALFLWHASINFYYMVPLPLVGCICFWVMQGVGRLDKDRQRLAKSILCIVVVIGLFTNFLFTRYPNVFNLGQENWDQQKVFYRANFNFNREAHFVWYWTLPGQRVALISGFATQILLQADREPFFYGSPTLMTQADLQRLLDQLDENKPGKVFVDKRLLSITGNAPLNALTDYLKSHYQYSGQQSDHLALMQRNHG